MDAQDSDPVIQELIQLHTRLRAIALSLSGHIKVSFEKKGKLQIPPTEVSPHTLAAIESAQDIFKHTAFETFGISPPNTGDLFTFQHNVIASDETKSNALFSAIVSLQRSIIDRIKELSPNSTREDHGGTRQPPSTSASTATSVSTTTNRKTVRDMMKDGRLAHNVQNLANAAAFLPLDTANPTGSQATRVAAGILADTKDPNSIPEIALALRQDPKTMGEFAEVFTHEVIAARAQMIQESGGKVLIAPDLTDAQAEELLRTIADMSHQMGTRGAQAFFINTTAKNIQQLKGVRKQEEQSLSSNAIIEIRKKQHANLPLSSGEEKLLEDHEAIESLGSQYQAAISAQEELVREDRTRRTGRRVRRLFSQQASIVTPQDSTTPGEEIFETYTLPDEIAPQWYQELLQSGEMDDGDLIGGPGSALPTSPGTSSQGGQTPHSPQIPRPPRGISPTGAGTKNALKRMERLRQTASAVKLLFSPGAVVAVGAGAGVGLTIYGLLTQSIPLVGAGIGVGAGAAIGAGIGFFAGGPIGALFGGVVGAIGGGASGYAVGQSIAPSINLGPIVDTARTASQLGQGGLSALAKGAPEGISAASKVAASGIQAGQAAASNLASSALGATKTGLSILQAAGGVSWASSAVGMGTTVGGLAVGLGAATIVTQTVLLSTFLAKGVVSEVSKYAEITKSVAPKSVFENTELPIQVTYTVTIKAKTDYTVTIQSLTDTASVTSAAGAPPLVNLNDAFLAAVGTTPFTLNPGETKTITYQASFSGSEYKDTRIANTVSAKISATSKESGEKSEDVAVGSAVVTIGNPPDNLPCINLVDGGKTITLLGGEQVTTANWTDQDRQHIVQAFSVMNQYPRFIELLCSGGTVNLYRVARNQYFNGTEYSGERITGGIALFNLSFRLSWLDMRRTLVHELSHYIDGNNGNMRDPFSRAVGREGPDPSGRICTYPLGYDGYPGVDRKNREDFAESVAQYFVFEDKESLRCHILHDMDTIYPKRYEWVKQNIAGGLSQPDDSSLP